MLVSRPLLRVLGLVSASTLFGLVLVEVNQAAWA